MQNIKSIIRYDELAESPRDWDNLGTMVCAHRRYTLGDEQLEADRFESWQEVKDDLVNNEHAVVVLPLYLYDHSGITMYTSGDTRYRQHEAWDSGQVGFIYVTREKVREEYGTAGKANIAKAEQVLRGEIETYDQFLRGEVYYAEVIGEDGEVVESCGGLYGYDAAEEFVKENREVAHV